MIRYYSVWAAHNPYVFTGLLFLKYHMDEDNNAQLLSLTILAVFFWGALFYACERLVCSYFLPQVQYNTTSSAVTLPTKCTSMKRSKCSLQQQDRIQNEDINFSNKTKTPNQKIGSGTLDGYHGFAVSYRFLFFARVLVGSPSIWGSLYLDFLETNPLNLPSFPLRKPLTD